jgi:nucleoside-diphosphate-sugar epimerase
MVRELLRREWDVEAWDIRNGYDARGLFRIGTIVYDLIVHCAYHVGGRAAIDGRPQNFARNVELDSALCTWAANTRQRRILYFSSSAAYPVSLQTGELPYRLVEDDATGWTAAYPAILTPGVPCRRDDGGLSGPDARYGLAKLIGESLLSATAETGIATHVVRPFSGYGIDQDDVYPFPALIDRVRQHVSGEPFTVWGPHGQTRDWIHIDDVVRGALAVVDADERRPVNLCTGIGWEFGDLARMMLDAAGKTGEIVYDTAQPTGVMHRVGDPTRMVEFYEPAIRVDQVAQRALRKAV